MNKKLLLNGLASTMILTMVCTVVAYANSNKSGGPGGGKQGPPPEAIEACDGMKEGDSVTFKGRNGESLKATCQSVNDQLAAVPAGHKK